MRERRLGERRVRRKSTAMTPKSGVFIDHSMACVPLSPIRAPAGQDGISWRVKRYLRPCDTVALVAPTRQGPESLAKRGIPATVAAQHASDALQSLDHRAGFG